MAVPPTGSTTAEPGFDQERLARVFFPKALATLNEVKAAGARFVHYTSTAAAVGILTDREVWMRKSTCMNDYSEVAHGLDCLFKAYRGAVGTRFKAALDAVADGTSAELEKRFNSWVPWFQQDTYIACFSQHTDKDDKHGRLSMWRAYGADGGVALVVNSAPFWGTAYGFKAYSSPVAYLSDEEFNEEFAAVAALIQREAAFLRILPREALVSTAFGALRFAAICAKHPGFKEEQEWRVVYCPSLDRSDYLKHEVRVINGVVQPIYKIPLRDVPEIGLTGIEIPALIERVIIGPTQYGPAMQEAFIHLLEKAGCPDPGRRVFLSNIPLRR
jgi:hypothetical protein